MNNQSIFIVKIVISLLMFIGCSSLTFHYTKKQLSLFACFTYSLLFSILYFYLPINNYFLFSILFFFFSWLTLEDIFKLSIPLWQVVIFILIVIFIRLINQISIWQNLISIGFFLLISAIALLVVGSKKMGGGDWFILLTLSLLMNPIYYVLLFLLSSSFGIIYHLALIKRNKKTKPIPFLPFIHLSFFFICPLSQNFPPHTFFFV